MSAEIHFKGFGLSFVDSEPKEMLYLSVYKMGLIFKMKTEQTSKLSSETSMNIDLSVYHFQIDNQVSRKKRSNIIFGPLQELDFTLMDEEDYSPFF
jgi:hypothetical protein